MASSASAPAPAPWFSPGAIATAACILRSHQHAFGGPLIAASCQLAQELFAAPTLVLAHDNSPLDQDDGPRLIYANRAALTLWRLSWSHMIGMPSKLTAEPVERSSRQSALVTAQQRKAISGYAGIRIDSHGRRFQVQNARLWTLRSPSGSACGQAAAFSNWWWL